MSLLIKNGRVLDPKNDVDDILDILIENSKIVAIGKNLINRNNEIEEIDAKRKLITPGLVDMHVHFRIPGFNYKEDLKTGTKAALKGGVTSVATMPNTNPVIDNIDVLEEYYNVINNQALINIYPIASVTLGQNGEKLVEFDSLSDKVVAFSDDGMPIMNREMLIKAFEEVPDDKAIISHCEDFGISKKYTDIPWPCKGEYIMVERNIDIVKETSKKLHIAHISCEESLNYIKEGKSNGVNVTCEVTPHHFALSTEDIDLKDPLSKVNPPIRSKVHKEAIIKGIKEGYIDAIATDHAPHEEKSKKGEYSDASFGISGIESSFALAYTNLVLKEDISLKQVVSMMTYKPAEILGIDKGTLSVGAVADITIIDLDENILIDPSDYVSKGKNSPLNQYKAKSNIVMTIVGGKIMYKDGEFSEY